MTATMVGMDWGMAALGIHSAPRKAREVASRVGTRMADYGDHAAISNISVVRRRGDVVRPLTPLGWSASAMAVTSIRRRRERPAETDLLSETSDDMRSESVIHTVHGVTPTGEWFLLADVGAPRLACDQSPGARDPASIDTDDSWLVVVGHCVRDMINADALDVTPAYAN